MKKTLDPRIAVQLSRLARDCFRAANVLARAVQPEQGGPEAAICLRTAKGLRETGTTLHEAIAAMILFIQDGYESPLPCGPAPPCPESVQAGVTPSEQD